MIGGYYGTLIAFAVIGCLFSALLSLLPGLHVYNVMGFAIIAYITVFPGLDPLTFTMFLVGMLSGFGILFTITTVYLNAPDDSTVFMLFPTQKYLVQGRGHEGVMLTGLGSLLAVYLLIAILVFGANQVQTLRNVATPYYGYVLGTVIMFILMSEFPKDFGRSKGTIRKLWEGWKTLFVGYLVFILSALLGMVLFFKVTVPPDRAFTSLMFPFVGMFATSSVLVSIISEMEMPKQHIAKSCDAKPSEVARGVGGGTLGGLFAAFFPAITAGPGAMLAGHATASKGDKPFIVSGAASRYVYYVGAVMLFFLPGVHIRRGAIGMYVNLFFIPETTEQFYLLAGAIAITGGLAFIMLLGLSRFVVKLLERVSWKSMNMGVLCVILVIVFVMGGWQGLLTMSVGTAIGLLPVLFHSRRTGCLAVILVPIWLNMIGMGPTVAGWMGLL